ncbi:hypothetical protein [Desulfofundulus thermosubterraneus]|uniref:Uncharacterized protein n=1 Tax=Desulfofundulus thermosubterraneus DSM 16057 TaxID=1121432 RepID=A0A1M6EKF7_9FIRM|nr:hypothetical protein [Desulfofundulus thermosubterraneus]SHI85876.1 hypothetical protein SAMN02745219_01226 [Desulfofundulus thermosubterraneus DSM 16057]
MPWVITFAISWLVFFALAERRSRVSLLVGGLVACVIQLFTDFIGQDLHLYRISDPVLPIFCSSAFFTFGSVFTMGALFGQYLPSPRWLQGLHILVFSGLFLLQEHMFMLAGVLEYIRWYHPASFLVNFTVFVTLAWVVESQRRGWR